MIIGKDKKSVLLTLVDRKMLYTIIVKLDNKQASEVAKTVVKVLYPLKQKVKIITFDNGLEFADHEIIGKKLETRIYFSHPYPSWQRGSNKNINGLIRQYFPKETDFNEVSAKEINFVVNRLNNHPEKQWMGKHRMNYLSKVDKLKNKNTGKLFK